MVGFHSFRWLFSILWSRYTTVSLSFSLLMGLLVVSVSSLLWIVLGSDFCLSWCILRIGITGSYWRSIFSYLITLYTDFHHRCHSLHSHYMGIWVSFSLHPCQQVFVSRQFSLELFGTSMWLSFAFHYVYIAREPFFIGLLVIWICSFIKDLLIAFAHVFTGLFIFLSSSFWNSL